MVAVFATMTLALLCGWFGRRSLAVALFACCLALCVGLFLFESTAPSTVPDDVDTNGGDSAKRCGDGWGRSLASHDHSHLNYCTSAGCSLLLALTAAMTLQYAKASCLPLVYGARGDVGGARQHAQFSPRFSYRTPDSPIVWRSSLVVAVRQSMSHLPATATSTSQRKFGILAVWSIIIAMCCCGRCDQLAVSAATICVAADVAEFPAIKRAASVLSLYYRALRVNFGQSYCKVAWVMSHVQRQTMDSKRELSRPFDSRRAGNKASKRAFALVFGRYRCE